MGICSTYYGSSIIVNEMKFLNSNSRRLRVHGFRASAFGSESEDADGSVGMLTSGKLMFGALMLGRLAPATARIELLVGLRNVLGIGFSGSRDVIRTMFPEIRTM